MAGPALWTRLQPAHMCLLASYLCQLTPRYLTVVVGCCPAMSAVGIGQRVAALLPGVMNQAQLFVCRNEEACSGICHALYASMQAVCGDFDRQLTWHGQVARIGAIASLQCECAPGKLPDVQRKTPVR